MLAGEASQVAGLHASKLLQSCPTWRILLDPLSAAQTCTAAVWDSKAVLRWHNTLLEAVVRTLPLMGNTLDLAWENKSVFQNPGHPEVTS